MRWALTFLILGLPRPALALGQETKAQEIRFHRVHLHNGNFIDGALVKHTDEEVILKIKGGEMSIRVDLIARVELVRMRSVKEAPDEAPPVRKPKPPVETPDPFAGTPDLRTAEPLPAPRVATQPRSAAELFPAGAAIKGRIEPILKALEEADIEQKSVVVRRLTETEGETAPYLASLLEEADPDLFPHLVSALTLMKDPRALPVLILQLESMRPAVRASSAAILAANEDVASARALWPLLRDDVAEVRAAALAALRGLAAADLLRHLPPLCADPDRAVRTPAIDALFDLSKKHGTEGSLASSLAAALDRSQGVATIHLIGAMGNSGKNELGSILRPYLSAESSGVRAAAAAALGNLGGTGSSSALLARLSVEKDKWARLDLARAVEKLKTFKAAGPLIDWIEDPDAEVRAAALQALETVSGKSFGPARDRWASWWAEAKPAD